MPPAAPGRSVRLVRAALFLVALGLGTFALRSAWRLYQQVPAVALGRIDWPTIERRRASLGGEAGEGRVLAILSNHVTRAYQKPTELPDLLRDAQAGAAQVRSTALPRLQIAALVLLAAQRDQVPPDEQWARVKPYLEGLQTASLAHHLLALEAADAAALQQAGLLDGIAARVAELHFNEVHGPLLQYLVGELTTFEAARAAAGDAAGAALAQQLADRWLRDWIIEPGPAGLRLLAADLLGQRLEQRGVQPDLVAKCRAWRAAYRTAAGTMPAWPALFDVNDAPLPPRAATAPRDYVNVTWAAGTLTGAMLLALVGGLFWIATPGSVLSVRAAALTAVVALAVAFAGVFVIAARPAWVDSECQRWARFLSDNAGHLGWPQLPGVAAALAALAVFALATLLRHTMRDPVPAQPDKRPPIVGAHASWPATLGGVATVAVLVLAPLTVCMSVIARVMLFHFSHVQPQNADLLLRTLADPAAQGLLSALQAWHP